MEETAKISYRIDAQDHIVFVNDEWSNFALANNGAHLVKESVLHTSLWRFITDLTTEYLYRQILRRVRTGIEMRFTLRCDAPETKRLLEMLITPMAGGEVRFTTVPVWVEGRISQRILQNGLPHEDYMIVVCSWCNKLEVAENIWSEVEEAAQRLGIFHVEIIPKLTHGICGDCYKKMSLYINPVSS